MENYLIILLIGFALGIATYKFIKLAPVDKFILLKRAVLKITDEMEVKYGGGTGTQKFEELYARVMDMFPWIMKLFGTDEACRGIVEVLVVWALKELKIWAS